MQNQPKKIEIDITYAASYLGVAVSKWMQENRGSFELRKECKDLIYRIDDLHRKLETISAAQRNDKAEAAE